MLLVFGFVLSLALPPKHFINLQQLSGHVEKSARALSSGRPGKNNVHEWN